MIGYIARSSYKIVAIFTVLALMALIFGILPLFFVAILAFVVYFFRDPEREPATDDALALLSPIDGVIKEIGNVNFEGEECAKVVIEKGFFDVGVLRAPCDIVDANLRRRHGLFLCTHMKISPALSERALYVCQGAKAKFAMRIVAGAFSRNLSLQDFKTLKTGRRFGFLSSGVVVMFLPRDTKICVSVGESVRAAKILGYFDK